MSDLPRKPSRRRFLVRAGAAGIGLAAALPRPALGAQAAPGRRPNLLFVLTDDQRWDMMGCAGNPIIHTPEMDRLARDGVRFLHSFVTTSICAAGRASVLTGTYERTHRFTFGTPPLRAQFTDHSYPTVLKAAGYRTGFVGKLGVGIPAPQRGKMFDWFRPMGRHPYFKKQPDGTEHHLTDLIGDESIGFLREAAKGKQPFCLSVSFNAPHAEDSDKRQYFWPKAMDPLYRDVKVPVPKTAAPAFFDQQPGFRQKSLNRVRWHWRFETPAMAQEMTKGYYRMISGVDAVLGRLRAELKSLGIDDNTVIVFTGDNGYFLGERGWAGKWTGHEVSLRVPLLIVDPRAPQARRHTTAEPVALNVDIAPTLVDLAGLPVPEPMQGRSLVPILGGRTPKDWRTDFFHEHLFDHHQIPKYEGVRTPRHTYIRWFEQQPVHEELYDNAADPHQERNLATVPAHAALLDRLRRRTDALRDPLGGPFKPWPKRPQRSAAKLQPKPARYVDGVKGKAAAFDGKTTYLPLGTTPAIARDGAFTWSAWLYLEPAARRPGVVLGNRRLADGRDTTQLMKVTADDVQLFNGRGAGARIPHGIAKGKWAHLAIVKDGATVTCYVDGKKVGSAPMPFGLPALPLYAGGDPHARELAPCRVDEVALYAAAITAGDLAALAALKNLAREACVRQTFEASSR
ncbi:sulfatase-like hydrolase/transferase [bacterium]|nr:sulfatase-like hydrolase/transferase [bacterium]